YPYETKKRRGDESCGAEVPGNMTCMSVVMVVCCPRYTNHCSPQQRQDDDNNTPGTALSSHVKNMKLTGKIQAVNMEVKMLQTD
ncbi:hypothetical protein MAR_015694, partial [Mya arenaria]